MANRTLQYYDGAAADLAAAIQDELRRVRGPEGDRGVRQDSMHVLLGATMPAVLVEAGFIDHPREGRELRTRGLFVDLPAWGSHLFHFGR